MSQVRETEESFLRTRSGWFQSCIPARQIPESKIPISLFFSTPTMLSMRAKPSQAILDFDSTQLRCTQNSYSKLCCYKMYRTYLKVINSKKANKISKNLSSNHYLEVSKQLLQKILQPSQNIKTWRTCYYILYKKEEKIQMVCR